MNKEFDKLRLLSNMSRYIDDIIVFNINDFQQMISDIYPPELKAEQDINDDKNLYYLDPLLMFLLYHQFRIPILLALHRIQLLLALQGILNTVQLKGEDFPPISLSFRRAYWLLFMSWKFYLMVKSF